jgi:serine-type D-Ala-D-Ala carboxypeptidase/endopeptidase (penicillin-binding protein 4)
MRKILFITFFFWQISGVLAQTVVKKLETAFRQFESDPQLSHAISSLYVIDASTGKVVFGKNQQVGLAPASTQKIITAATAFELLGKEFRYKTDLLYYDKIQNGVLNGNLYFKGSGDPTLGSWRWGDTKDSFLLRKWGADIKKKGITRIDGRVWFVDDSFSAQSIPDGWIWQDIGNYYGAGSGLLNWKENQYDVALRSGNTVGSSVEILPPFDNNYYINELKAGPKGSGDNAYVYYDDVIAGTIPAGEKAFRISAAQKDPISDLVDELSWYLNSIGVATRPSEHRNLVVPSAGISLDKTPNLISTHYSPTLDSIIYWFLQKSINLYGEALIKTFAYTKKGFGNTAEGVDIVTDFWKQKGLDENELNISDGSGLSPQNRVTTHAQVEILKYASKQPWFSYFYDALPEYNKMKMKSGTIKNVKGFCGYHKAKDGKEYIFSFLVNNYNGPSSGLVNKMYKVLDILK